jgi:hypothetical protein
MHPVYGADYEGLYARIEEGRSGGLVAFLPLPNGNEQLCFLDRCKDLKPGDVVEVMITGVIHPTIKGRKDRRKVIALTVRVPESDDIMMGISGFEKANPRDPASSLAIENDGQMLTESAMRTTLDMHSRRPLSVGQAARLTRVVTPGKTGAYAIRNASNNFREGSLQLAEATNVWVSRRAVLSKGRKPIAINGLTCIEDLECFELLHGRAPLRKAA